MDWRSLGRKQIVHIARGRWRIHTLAGVYIAVWKALATRCDKKVRAALKHSREVYSQRRFGSALLVVEPFWLRWVSICWTVWPGGQSSWLLHGASRYGR